MWCSGKEPEFAYRHEMQVQFPDWEDPLGKEMAVHSSVLAWKILWTEGLGGLCSMSLKETDTPEQTHICTLG